MPAISKIRFTNVIYENGGKRYNDDIFQFEGYNGAIILENGGGKTVFVQTALQAILPHYNMEERKIRDTLLLEGDPCHIAIEWILNDHPRRYLVTAVTLFLANNKLDSYRYAYEYGFDDEYGIEHIPFVKEMQEGNKGATGKREILDYYQYMQSKTMNAKLFKTITEYQIFLEENYKIIPSEWRSIARINDAEGGVEGYFESCKTTGQLVDRLLIPVLEEAISEDGAKSFTEAFEEQRARFKKHKELRERIGQSREISKEIDEYVQVYRGYHQAQNDFIHKKKDAKAIYLHLQEEETSIEKAKEQNDSEREALETLKRELERKEASYNLAVLKKKLDTAEVVMGEAKKELEESRFQYNANQEKIENLNVAKLKKEIKELEDNIEHYRRQIKILESELDVEDIKDQLEVNASKLKSSFMKEEEELTKEKSTWHNSQVSREADYKENQQILKNLGKSKEDISNEMSNKEGRKKEKEDLLKKMRGEIIGLSPTDDIKKQQQTWMEQVGILEKANAESIDKKNNLESESVDLKGSIKIDRERWNVVAGIKGVAHKKMESLKELHDQLLFQIKSANNSWHYIDSLYLKQSSIMGYMVSKYEHLRKEKEDLLLEERRAGRFKDDYEDSAYFTADPMLQQWIEQWKNQFKYIETGTQYIQRAIATLKQENIDLAYTYPFWTTAMVVEDGKAETLRERVMSRMESMTSPIFILEQGEARGLLEEARPMKELVVLPKFWKSNIEQEKFISWKKEVEEKAVEATKKRKLKEEELSAHNDLLKSLEEFFRQYSHEDYTGLKEEIQSLELEYESLEKNIKEKEVRSNEIHREIEGQNNQILHNIDQINSFNSWIKLAQKCMITQGEISDLKAERSRLQDKIDKIGVEIETVKKYLTREEDIIEDIKERVRGLETRITTLKENSLYKEVEGMNPIFTDISRDLLIEQRKDLEKIREKSLGDVKNYYDYIRKDEKSKERAVTNLDRARRQKTCEIDEEFVFPPFGEDELERLIDEMGDIRSKKSKLEGIFKEKEKYHQDILVDYKAMKTDFDRKFQVVEFFKDTLDNVWDTLRSEKEEFNIKEKHNTEIRSKLLKTKEAISEQIQRLYAKNERYDFLTGEVERIALNEDFYRDFPYKRKEWIENILTELEEISSNVKDQETALEGQKNKFLFFCNGITDPRLREQTISGVKEKSTYKEVLEWQSKIQGRIEHIIKIAEQDLREHDKDLEQFIHHLCLYLRTLTDELNVIPKKTRIKVEDKWREIYQFNIPEWKDEDGKEEIRKHIDWILRQLERDEFKNEDGSDNGNKISKEIEKWLDSKQLLPIVLKNSPIKISCRKVTNDGKIGGGLHSWENSNRWSGGEKWSKNMTLFLGILNYVAEKRQGIIPGLKTNRTVIVDNPFGKASSDHVLDPVFFIAEKLGFQIIALTAHTEGSYIRNYFPVVYSCRLREATNNSFIIDKEKEIQYVFFRDKDPEALNRLEDRKQLDLFDF